MAYYHGQGDGYHGARDVKAIAMDFPYNQPMTSQMSSQEPPMQHGAEDTEAPGFTASAGRRILFVFIAVLLLLTGTAVGLYFVYREDDDDMDMDFTTITTTTSAPTTTPTPTTTTTTSAR